MSADGTSGQTKRQSSGDPSGGSEPALLVEVVPAARRGESASAVRAALLVVVVALLWIGGRNRGASNGAGDGAAARLPYQIAFATLPSELQRSLRELHEGTLELIRLRGDDGRWPEAARLAAEGIPPFADDGVARGRRRWSSLSSPYLRQYLGSANREDGTRALLIQLLEPRPGEMEGRDPRAPVMLDEQHRRLADGTLLHVSFWIAPTGFRSERDEPIADPARAGFQQVLTGSSAPQGPSAASNRR